MGSVPTDVPDLECPDCERIITMLDLETRTVAQSDGFRTTYRCPYCGAEFEDVKALM
jgi:uncharacterized C2H2 Zn-finger protein